MQQHKNKILQAKPEKKTQNAKPKLETVSIAEPLQNRQHAQNS